MIVNEATRTLFLEVPKTGSTTIRIAYVSLHGDQKYERTWTHVKLEELPRVFAKMYPDQPFEQYTQYAFYRNPIERMVSAWRYSLGQWERARLQEPQTRFSVYVRTAALFHLIWGVSFDEEAKPSLVNVTLDDVMDALESKVVFPTADLFTPQSCYIDTQTVLLDYSNYDAEYQRLVPLLGLPAVLSPHVARLNTSDAADHIPNVTASQIQRIKNYYKDDYELFASRGITFSEAFGV